MESEPQEWRVVITSASSRSAEVAEALQCDGWEDAGGSLVLEKPALQFRAADASVLVATIAAASSALVTLVSALLQRGAAKDGRHIVLEFDNVKIDVPADIRPEQLDKLMEQVSSRPNRIILP
ncbi:hypothetical protein [Streptomyces sp. NPDC051636]|uniref:hypothetical protein n=1 Tax=Streptomyces sp. NPDC051636 TaxID=3365663 RepID=UPI0037A6C7BD